MYSKSCMDVKTAISNSKSEILLNKISDCNGDQKKLFKIVDTLLARNKQPTLPKYDSPLIMASVMNNIFSLIRLIIYELSFALLEANLPCYSFLFKWILLCQYALLLNITLTVLLTLNFKKLFLV